MMRLFLSLGLLLLFILPQLSCQRAGQELKWLKKNSIPIASVDGNDFSDLAFLQEKLEDIRLVQIGESSHGAAEFYQLKTRLVEYLHQEMNFDVLVIEGGFGDINLAWLHQEDQDAKSLMYNSVFGNFRAEEMLPLFEYAKTQARGDRPLALAGPDCQSSSNYFNNFLIDFLRKYNTELSRDVEYNFMTTSLLYGLIPDSTQLIAAIRTNERVINRVLDFLENNEAKIREDFPQKPLLAAFTRRALENYLEYWALDYRAIRLQQQFALRDRIMAENLMWLADVAYPNQKIIYWAHNAHIGTESNSVDIFGKPLKMQGNYVADRFGKQVYNIGLYASGGELFRHWMRDVQPFKDDSIGGIGERFGRLPKAINFLELRGQQPGKGKDWLFKPLPAFELESGGKILFTPTKKYDALIVVKKVKGPKFFE
ncbi:erythromycin esterase family protein [Haliscomenobacter sp.]|uniref:erythromycin esterase family protein n=1 Tax=Haliscomenobacter sp. TaxID=2717303 RepID=UPI003594640B